MKQPDSSPVPSAPYPPMHAGSPVRSSMSSSPQYRTRTESSSVNTVRTASPVAGSSNIREEVDTDGATGAFSRQPSNRNAQGSVSKVQFYGNGRLACINVATSSPQNEVEESQRSRKLGPVLMELRQLELSQKENELFDTKTIALSRGNPQLGTSVSSTCLDLPVVQSYNTRFAAATGLTTGMLAIHTFSQDSGADDLPYSSAIEYYHVSRHHRQSSAVAWRTSQANHVAIGLVGSGSQGPQQGPRRGGTTIRGTGDREFCCFVWDVETSTAKRHPISKLSHNTPVASLAWVMDGQTLAVGTQSRNVQLYDMRISGANAPPLSALAHSFGVHGIAVEPHRSNIMATFCRAVGEPVKIWDVRRMDAAMNEIKFSSTASKGSSHSGTSKVENIQWSAIEPGVLSVATEDSVQDYDAASSSRPTLLRENHAPRDNTIQDFALYNGPSYFLQQDAKDGKNDEISLSDKLFRDLYSHRMVAVLGDRTVCDMPKHGAASPVAISRRDGRLVHTLGPKVWVGSTTLGPAAMEGPRATPDEDISATMMRRARCARVPRYSMNTSQNIKMLADDIPTGAGVAKNALLSKLALYRLWVWIERVEALSTELEESEGEVGWTAKNIFDAGVLQLLNHEGKASKDEVGVSETLDCLVYNSPARRLALTSCGWAGNFSLEIVLAECEDLGEFERSAALAVWHGEIATAVNALQRAADAVRKQPGDKESADSAYATPKYAETLDLIAMCVAGYGGTSSTQKKVWQDACSKLLGRKELADPYFRSSRTVYLRAMCHFLLSVGVEKNYDFILGNEYLAFSDRIAFACRFLDQESLDAYLLKCLEKCQQVGNVEGLVMSGLSKEGLSILQAFVDRTSDVQTAALVVSRVIMPHDWVAERKICIEWVETYRSLLNTWQMWQSRAMFDVDRATVLRTMKAKGNDTGARRMQNRRQTIRGSDADVMASIPAALDARCNYCSSPLGLKRHEGNANQWLSKMKPVLSCCPQCRKPLPRCAICLLSLGGLNPYMQLTRERSRPISRNTMSSQDDLGTLPLAEWFTWCMNCRHGGHAHHMVGWFANHETCPVSGCECRCQFDGIRKLSRPALAKKFDEDEDV